MCRWRRSGSWGLALAATLTVAACGDSQTAPSPPPPPPPQLTLTCPPEQTAVSATGQPVVVTWQGPVAQGGTPPINTTCTPASGAEFPVGTTSVGCAATSTAAGQSASCSFAVKVTKAPQLAVTKFMAFGDSITWGQDSPPGTFLAYPIPAPSYSYPTQLQSVLAAAYPVQTFTMANEGWPGEQVATGLARLPGAITTPPVPEVVLLLEGANDLAASPSSATTQYVASRLRDMVRTCKVRIAADRVLLANFPPQFVGTPSGRGAGQAFVPEMNGRIELVAANEGATLVDLYTPMSADVKRYIGQDGVHPTDQGFTLMAQTFAAVIRQKFEVKTTAR